jgi:hypothetical protein
MNILLPVISYKKPNLWVEVGAVKEIDEDGSRIGGKDLLAIMIAQFAIIIPIILLFGLAIGVVIWVIMRFWS